MTESYYREAEIQMMLDEFGVDTVVSGVTVKGVVDRTDEELLQAGLGHMLGKMITVVVKTGALPALALGVTVTVDGTAYKAHSIMQVGDGALTKVFCALT